MKKSVHLFLNYYMRLKLLIIYIYFVTKLYLQYKKEFPNPKIMEQI